jgi:hypothetical protein
LHFPPVPDKNYAPVEIPAIPKQLTPSQLEAKPAKNYKVYCAHKYAGKTSIMRMVSFAVKLRCSFSPVQEW